MSNDIIGFCILLVKVEKSEEVHGSNVVKSRFEVEVRHHDVIDIIDLCSFLFGRWGFVPSSSWTGETEPLQQGLNSKTEWSHHRHFIKSLSRFFHQLKLVSLLLNILNLFLPVLWSLFFILLIIIRWFPHKLPKSFDDESVPHYILHLCSSDR